MVQAIPDNSFTNAELEMMAHGNNPQANAYRQALAFRRNSPVTPDGWKVEAERMAELHGCSFVVFRHGEEPQCADPTKVIISFTDKGLGYADAASSPTARAVIRDEMKMGARLTNHRFKP